MKRHKMSYAEVNANMTRHEIQGHLTAFADLVCDRFKQQHPGLASIVGVPEFSYWTLFPAQTSRQEYEWRFQLDFLFGSHERKIVQVQVGYLAVFEQQTADLDTVVAALAKRFKERS